MIDMFRVVLNQNNNHTTKRCLKAMANWAESKLNFLNYPDLLRIVLTLSLQDVDKLDDALTMVF